jgi:hypothetical protein
MNTPNTTRDGALTAPGVTDATPAPRHPDQEHEPRLERLAVHVIAPAKSSWELILVDAGLDREARELPSIEHWMVDAGAG